MNHACVRMRPNYFVVDVLPSRQIKRVARPTGRNYERCVFVTFFPDEKYGSVDYELYIVTLDKLIKKERPKPFNRFKDQNTRRDSLYRHIDQSLRGLRLTLSHFCVIS